MELLKCKARLSVLWLVMAIGTAATMFLRLLTSGVIEGVMAGEMEGMQLNEGMLILYALFFIIPLVVAILSITLDGSANRWLNFVLGIIWVLWFIFQTVSFATGGEAAPIAIWLMNIAGLVISAYIIYFAWKLPIQEGWSS